ncbi:transposase [Chryseobacterium sp. WG23]|uniref:transposase n=1 Tax=Chryseobacterium sp. WG23 TaxID=2926910 RepID=UPI00359C9E05
MKRFSGNPHDSKTLEESLSQSQRVRELIGGTRPQTASADRGFRGIKEVENTQILIPQNKKATTKYQQEIGRKRFRARAAIEPTISHLKRNHSMGLNFLKGIAGDIHNALPISRNWLQFKIKIKSNQSSNNFVDSNSIQPFIKKQNQYFC